MSKAMSIRLPESLHEQIKELSEEEGISMNQFIAVAAAEKISAIKTIDYLKERAERGDEEALQRVLDEVPDREPKEYDKL